MKFATNIKNLRLSEGLTMQVFANSLGITKSGVSMWENGRAIPEVEMLIKISKMYDVSIDFLVGNNK